MLKRIVGFVFFVVFFILIPVFILNSNEEPKIGSGISIGNALDAPLGEYWGVTMSTSLLDEIKDSGFDTVRIPVRLSDYIDENYKLDEIFMIQLDNYINYGLELGLIVILDMHHFVELMDSELIGYNDLKKLPDDFDYELAFYEMWEQLSFRYKDYSENLFFEILNEPENEITPSKWNEMVLKTVSIIREYNPDRKIIISSAEKAIVEAIEELEVPDDGNLIVTFHYYSPVEFTFQNDENHVGYESDEEIEWTLTEENKWLLEYQFQIAADFASKNNVDILLGEFGVNKNAPRESRIAWISTIVEYCKKYDFGYVYWELGHNFGIYDIENDVWDKDILEVLVN